VLCGFKGCGKTVIGRALAERKAITFVDLDTLIEDYFCKDKDQQLSFREIYKRIGQNSFRKLEKATLAHYLPEGEVIFSVGGGTLMDSENVETLKKLGRLVYLSVEDDLLFERIMADGIPATFDKTDPRGSFELLMTQRRGIYEKACEINIDVTSYTVKEAAEAVYNVIN
jgi:shikimate kinase